MSAAGGKLAISVTVRGSNFELVTFAAGETPPAWARDLITNPKAWGSAPETESAPAPEGGGAEEPSEASSPGSDEGSQDEGPAEDEEDLLGSLGEPPRGGAGATKKAWAAYADSKGVEYAPDASRDDIIAAVDAAE